MPEQWLNVATIYTMNLDINLNINQVIAPY